MSFQKYSYSQLKPGTPGKRSHPPIPIVIRWFDVCGSIAAMYAVAHALNPTMPPTEPQYASLSTSGSFHASHIAIWGLPLYRSMIAETTSIWCA